MPEMDIRVQDSRGRSLVIGTIKKEEGHDPVFYKKVKRSKHFMRISSAYGIQKEVYDKYLRGKGITIVIHEEDTGDTFFSTTDDWEEHASHQNYGHGRQMFLSEKYMTKEGDDETL